MTATLRPLDAASGAGLAWPLWTLFAGYPLWWALGLSQFVWPTVAAVCVAGMAVTRRGTVPAPFGMWLLFLAFMVASVVEAQRDLSLLAFCLRAALYLSATVLALWVYNATENELPERTVVDTLCALWVATVVLGALGALLPTASFGTFVEAVLPRNVTANEFVQTFVHPSLAERQLVSGAVSYRLHAPFTYANEWGSFFALLTPFVVLRLTWTRHRGFWLLALAASVVPAVLSLNRAMWASLLVAAVVVGAQLVARGRLPAIAVLTAFGGVAVVMLSPLGRTILDRIGSEQSKWARSSVVQQAIDGANASPWLGAGGPRPSTVEYVPSVGTQGQLWMVLFSHGYPAAVLFVGFFAAVLLRGRRWRTPTELACAAAVLISFIQLPFYNQNLALHVVLVAAALLLRSQANPAPAAAAAAAAPHPTRGPG